MITRNTKWYRFMCLVAPPLDSIRGDTACAQVAICRGKSPLLSLPCLACFKCRLRRRTAVRGVAIDVDLPALENDPLDCFQLCTGTSVALGAGIMTGTAETSRLTTSWMQSKNLLFYPSTTRKQQEGDDRSKCIWSANACFI